MTTKNKRPLRPRIAPITTTWMSTCMTKSQSSRSTCNTCTRSHKTVSRFCTVSTTCKRSSSLSSLEMSTEEGVVHIEREHSLTLIEAEERKR